MANALTLARMGLVLPFAAMFFIGAGWAMTAALALFVVAALTDYLDGVVARRRGETSALGAALDPIADKLLIAAALILLVRSGTIRDAGVVAALVIILREVLISGLREALARYGQSLPVSPLAKWKTTAQLLAAGALLAAAPTGLAGEDFRPLASALLWAAAVLTLWTGGDYAVRAGRALRRVRE